MNPGRLGSEDPLQGLMAFLAWTDTWWTLVVGGVHQTWFMYDCYRCGFCLGPRSSNVQWDPSRRRRSPQAFRDHEEDLGPFPTSQQGGAFHSERRAGAKVKSLGCHNVFIKDKCYLEETLPTRPRVAHKGLAVSPRNARDSGSLLGGFWISSALTHWIILNYNYWGQISVHHELTEAESMLQMYLHLPVLSQPEFMN